MKYHKAMLVLTLALTTLGMPVREAQAAETEVAGREVTGKEETEAVETDIMETGATAVKIAETEEGGPQSATVNDAQAMQAYIDALPLEQQCNLYANANKPDNSPEVEIAATNFTYLINEGNIMITGYNGEAQGILTIAPSYLIDGVSCKVTKIGYRAFYKQTKITAVILPEGLINIGRGAFMNCISLQHVYLPSTVQAIYDYAFRNCVLLTDVFYPNTNTEWNEIQMGDNNTLLIDATRNYNAYSTS